MKTLAVAFLLALMPSRAFSGDISIVDVRRNIPLSDEEPAYKDFYLNAGDGSGLKKNLVVTAVRKLTVRDSAGSQAFGDIDIPVGQLRVIAVFGKVAVAREYKLLSRDDQPMLEQIGLMVGDRIELKGSFVDDKPAPKKKVAETEAPNDTARATASVAPSAPATAAAPVPPSPAVAPAPANSAGENPAAPVSASPAAPLGEKTAAAVPAAH